MACWKVVVLVATTASHRHFSECLNMFICAPCCIRALCIIVVFLYMGNRRQWKLYIAGMKEQHDHRANNTGEVHKFRLLHLLSNTSLSPSGPSPCSLAVLFSSTSIKTNCYNQYLRRSVQPLSFKLPGHFADQHSVWQNFASSVHSKKQMYQTIEETWCDFWCECISNWNCLWNTGHSHFNKIQL